MKLLCNDENRCIRCYTADTHCVTALHSYTALYAIQLYSYTAPYTIQPMQHPSDAHPAYPEWRLIQTVSTVSGRDTVDTVCIVSQCIWSGGKYGVYLLYYTIDTLYLSCRPPNERMGPSHTSHTPPNVPVAHTPRRVCRIHPKMSPCIANTRPVPGKPCFGRTRAGLRQTLRSHCLGLSPWLTTFKR